MNQKPLFLLLFILLLFTQAQAQTMRVATYNLRFDNPGDSLNSWKYRFPYVKDLIRYHDFDIFGTQEGLIHQLNALKEDMPEYDFIGVGRNDGKESGEFSALFYKKEKFEVLKKGNFWLSETPEKPGKGWDADFPRICSWGQLKDKKTGFTFYVFNAHLDHKGEVARRESVKLLLKKIKEIAGNSPAILSADFNFSQKDEKYSTLANSGLLKDSYQLADLKYTPNGTFNGFNINTNTDERIDHIFVTDDFKVKKFAVLTDSYKGRFPSDHFPVVIDITW